MLKNKKNSLILVTLLTLTSCHKGNDETINSTIAIKEVELSSLPKASTTYIDESGKERNLTMNTLYTNSGTPHVDSLSEQRGLVIPFSFIKNDDDNNDTITSNSTLLKKINMTFTASEEDIKKEGGYISVNDFYQKSSYGNANLQFDVLDSYIQYNGTALQFEEDCGETYGGIYASSYIKNYYETEYVKEGHGKLGNSAKPLSYYDSDEDGYIDLLWIVYIYPYDSTNSNFWWAYVTYTGEEEGEKEKPNVQTLGWASSNFLYEDSSLNGYDSHTFIHETGHTFGLSDYYDYKGTFSPLGGVDYMDHNLGDHCAYSKFSLGWVSPYVIREETLKEGYISLSLNAFTSSGEVILLASPGYNNSAFDEYFLIELVAPVSFAKEDYLNGYQSYTGYDKPGIRITHIDSRVYNEKHDEYIVNIDEIGREGKALRLSNSYMGRNSLKIDGDYYEVKEGDKKYDNSYSLISIIESNIKDKNTMNTYSYSSDSDSLFKEGDSFYLKKNGKNSIWAKTYMPSASNLYNKSKKITGWTKTDRQIYVIDETMKFSYSLSVVSINENSTYGYSAKINIGLID